MSDTAIATQFLLEEYKELNNSLHINEERGEKRLEFFVTLSSFVLGAIGYFIKEFKTYDPRFLTLIYLMIILFLSGLLYIGFIVQNRLRKRNSITDGFKKDLQRIRAIIKDLDAGHEVLPADYSAFVNPAAAKGGSGRKNTSLYHIAAVINCVIGGTVFAFITFALAKPIIIVAGGSLLVAVLIGLATLGKKTHAVDISHDDRATALTHAGGVVFKIEGGKIKFLLVTSSKDEKRWVLPKGHIEKNETAEFAAIREVVEEAGILAQPRQILGVEQYQRLNEKIVVRYYLMQYIKEAALTREPRKMAWLTKEEAIKQISCADTRRILEML